MEHEFYSKIFNKKNIFLILFIIGSIASRSEAVFYPIPVAWRPVNLKPALPPPPSDCNNPIAGKGIVVDQLSGDLASLLSNTPDFEHTIDGDLSNYTEIGLTSVTGVGNISLISVKDLNEVYPAGQRAGFVLEITNSLAGLLGADVLNSLLLRTYLNNEVQETASTGGGPLISLNVMSGEGKKRRLDFLTSLPFDEIELIFTGVASSSLLSTFRIYYAYEEADGCDYDCAFALTTNNYPGVTASTDCEIFVPVVGCTDFGFNNYNNTTNGDTTDFASDVFILLESHYLDLTIGQDIPAGYDVGFAVEQGSLLGLLTLNVLGGMTITTYDNGSIAETFTANTSLANVSVLSGGINLISFKTAEVFDRVRLTVTSTLPATYRVYYGFIRPDEDNDGFTDCIDNCPGGDDNILNNQGRPLACNPGCPDVAGLNVNACPGAGTGEAQLPAAPPGYTWSPVPGNPSPAAVDPTGKVTGLVMEGVYLFELSNGVCFDTVAINFLETQGNIACNDPLAGPDVIISDNGDCELCGDPDAGNIIDGDLSNFAEYGNLLALSIGGGNTPLIAVQDTVQEYPAGTRAGFVVSFPSGLLSLNLLDAFSLRAYHNGTLVEMATNNGAGLLKADAVAAQGQQRLAFVSTVPFDEIELVVRSGFVSLDLLTTIRIFYAFTEPETCPSSESVADITGICGEPMTAASDYCAMLGYDRTGFTGVGCVECVIDSLSNLVDDDLQRPATIDLTAAALGEVSVSVKSALTISAGAEAGYAIGIDPGLLSAGVLDDFTLTTYLAGIEQESFSGSSPAVSLALLSEGSDVNFLGFVTTLDFDEVQLTLDATIASSTALGGTLSIYYAFVRYDSDSDGSPDCLDKCCSGPDFLDLDGDGNPDGCDAPCVGVEAWIYLEGAAVAPDGTQNYSLPMRTSLNNLRLLPGQTFEDFFLGTVYSPAGQPYDAAPWNYAGTEGLGFDSEGDPNTGDAGYAATVVDWVLVSLRADSEGTGGPLCQATALVHSDGHLEFVAAFDCCDLDLNASFYLVIEHRNHLMVMSDQPVPVIGNTLTYDFRSSQSYIDDPFGFGVFAGQKEILPGVFAMFSGNGNQILTGASDTDINFDDRSFWEAENGNLARYRNGDYNLNGDVNFNDRRSWELNNGKFTSVPRN